MPLDRFNMPLTIPVDWHIDFNRTPSMGAFDALPTPQREVIFAPGVHHLVESMLTTHRMVPSHARLESLEHRAFILLPDTPARPARLARLARLRFFMLGRMYPLLSKNLGGGNKLTIALIISFISLSSFVHRVEGILALIRNLF